MIRYILVSNRAEVALMRKPWRTISVVLGAFVLVLGGIAVVGISSAAEDPPFSRAAKPLGGCQTNLEVYEEAVRSLALSKEMEDSARLEALENTRNAAFLAYCDCLIAESAGRLDDRAPGAPASETHPAFSAPPAQRTAPRR